MVRRAKVLFNFTAQNEDELTVSAGDTLGIIGEENDGWVLARDEDTGTKGLVPTNYLEPITSPRVPSILLPLDGQPQPPVTKSGSRSNSVIIIKSGADSNGPSPRYSHNNNSGRRSNSTTHSPERIQAAATSNSTVVVETTPRREREEMLLRRQEQIQLECDRLRQENADLNVKTELLENQISNMELSFRTKTDVLERMDAKIKQLETEKSEFHKQQQLLQQQLHSLQSKQQLPVSSQQVRSDSRMSDNERNRMQEEIRRLQNDVQDLKRMLATAARSADHQQSDSSPRIEDGPPGQQPTEFRSKLRFFESQSRVFGAMPSSPNPKTSTSNSNGSARQKKTTQSASSNRTSTRFESIKNKFETDDGVKLV